MAVEDVLIAIHKIMQKIQIELIHLRIQKNRFAFKMGEGKEISGDWDEYKLVGLLLKWVKVRDRSSFFSK